MTNQKSKFMYARYSIKDYLDELASKSPTPGGGSAAALVGAIGVSLLSMVANWTIGKEKDKAFEDEITEVLNRTETLREDFLESCSEDAKAYKKLSDAFKLPKNKERVQKIQDSLKEATLVPLDVCKNTIEAIKLCAALAEKGNVNLMGDVGSASFILNAAFQSALLNVKINLARIKDDKFTLYIKEAVKSMEKDFNIIRDREDWNDKKDIGNSKGEKENLFF